MLWDHVFKVLKEKTGSQDSYIQESSLSKMKAK